MLMYNKSVTAALGLFGGQTRGAEGFDDHPFEFSFVRGKYENDLDIGELNLDLVEVLRPAYYKPKQRAFSDADLVSFSYFCSMNAPVEPSDESKAKRQQKRLGFSLIDLKILSDFPWHKWTIM